MSLVDNYTMPVSTVPVQPVVIKRIETAEQAAALAPLYCAYYKRMELTPSAFIERWHHAYHFSPYYYLLAAYTDNSATPCGFLDFSIIPSIFWAPCIGRIDSVCIAPGYDEIMVADALFTQAHALWKHHKVSKVIAVSCEKFEQEFRLLQRTMVCDNHPTKRFFVLMSPHQNKCISG